MQESYNLFLRILYILNKEISWKKKLPRLLFVVFFLVSFANNYLDFIWHGLHFPNSLPGRQAFLYSLLLLLICYETVLHLRGNRIWHVAVALVANGAFLSAAYFFSDKELVGALQIGIRLRVANELSHEGWPCLLLSCSGVDETDFKKSMTLLKSVLFNQEIKP